MTYRHYGEVQDEQRRRREADELRPHHDWAVKREALIASGLVEERRQARAPLTFGDLVDMNTLATLDQYSAELNADLAAFMAAEEKP